MHQPDPATPIADTLGALGDLVKEGKVREIGCSNFSAEQLQEAEAAVAPGAPRFVSVQNQYSLLHREPELTSCPNVSAWGSPSSPTFPLMSGVLSGKYRRGEPPPAGTRLAGMPPERQQELLSATSLEQVEALERYATEQGHTILELAIAWLAAKPAVASVIAGATKPEQIWANAKAADWVLPSEEVREVDAIAPMPRRRVRAEPSGLTGVRVAYQRLGSHRRPGSPASAAHREVPTCSSVRTFLSAQRPLARSAPDRVERRPLQHLVKGVEHGEAAIVLAHCALGHQLGPGLDARHVAAGEDQGHRPGAVSDRATQHLCAPPGLHLHRGDAAGDPRLLAPLDVADRDRPFDCHHPTARFLVPPRRLLGPFFPARSWSCSVLLRLSRPLPSWKGTTVALACGRRPSMAARRSAVRS